MTMEHRRARLAYRARRRGTLEMDLILGRFADRNLARFSEAELTFFEEILAIPEQDLYDWIIRRQPVPARHRSPVMTLLLSMDTAFAPAPDERPR